MKKLFKAPSRDQIKSIIENDIPVVYNPEKFEKILAEVKSEEDLDKVILKNIKDGYIKKKDWRIEAPKNKEELKEKEKELFYTVEAMIEFRHAENIEKIKIDKLSGEEKEDISLYIKLANSFKFTDEELDYWHQILKLNNKSIKFNLMIENQIEYKVSQDHYENFLNFIREDKAEKFALSQIEDLKTFKENKFYLKDIFLNKKTSNLKNKKYLIVLRVSDEFARLQESEIKERLKLMLKHKKIKDPKIIAEIKKVLG